MYFISLTTQTFVERLKMKIEIDDKEMAKAIKQAVLGSIERMDISTMIEDKLCDMIYDIIEIHKEEITQAMLTSISGKMVS